MSFAARQFDFKIPEWFERHSLESWEMRVSGEADHVKTGSQKPAEVHGRSKRESISVCVWVSVLNIPYTFPLSTTSPSAFPALSWSSLPQMQYLRDSPGCPGFAYSFVDLPAHQSPCFLRNIHCVCGQRHTAGLQYLGALQLQLQPNIDWKYLGWKF